MPHYLIMRAESSAPVAEFSAADARDVLKLSHRHRCRHVHVREDGDYLFSAWLDDSETWHLYHQRNNERDELPVRADFSPEIVSP